MTDHTRSSAAIIALRAAVFAVVFTALQFAWQNAQGTSQGSAVIHDAIVRPAAALINAFTPATHAQASGAFLDAPGGSLNIEIGCDGMEGIFLLIAAFAATPLSLLSRISGVALGIMVVFVVNQARIVALFYSSRTNQALFSQLHLVIGPILIVTTVSLYFYAWLAYSSRQMASAA